MDNSNNNTTKMSAIRLSLLLSLSICQTIFAFELQRPTASIQRATSSLLLSSRFTNQEVDSYESQDDISSRLFIDSYDNIYSNNDNNNVLKFIDMNNIWSSSVDEQITTSQSTTTTRLPPVIQQIADERMEFRINLGRAMDTLRRDMQAIIVEKPDFTIYHEEIQAVDPSGIQLNGLKNYESAISFFQAFIRFWFHSRACRIQYRMVYDFARSSIRISWHMELIPKLSALSFLSFANRPTFVDGISHYTLEPTSGKITEHKIENLLINNSPVAPPYGILNILQQDLLRINRQTPSPVPHGITGGVWGCQ